jgi:ribosomal protein L10
MNNNRKLKNNIFISNLLTITKNNNFIFFFHLKHLDSKDWSLLKIKLSKYAIKILFCKYSFLKKFFMNYFNLSKKLIKGNFVILYSNDFNIVNDFFYNSFLHKESVFPLYIFFYKRLIYFDNYKLFLEDQLPYIRLINLLTYSNMSILNSINLKNNL